MTEFSVPLSVSRAAVESHAGPFQRLTTTLRQGAALIEIEFATNAVMMEWLHPFSWDAGLRGVVAPRRRLTGGSTICLHAGPYGTADAVAHRNKKPMRFPDAGDGHRYLAGDAPGAHEDHQDAAAWTLVESGGHCVVLAWEYSGSLTTEVSVRDGRARIVSRLPADTFHPRSGSELWNTAGPIGWLAVVPGGLDAGASALRSLVIDEVVSAPDLSGMPAAAEFPCLVANSWGVQENTSTERILTMMDATAAIGAEVFVVDKGWERSVGDWHANDRFGTGLRWLSDQARERGMGFGVWCGFGNADPRSPVALEHPDWLATWRGSTPRLSFENHAICLGHDPARDWIQDELRRLVTDFRLTWFLHDFESIARCDRDDHTHDPGAGEHAAELAWHHILRTLKAEFPQLVVENCWNGVRPLDLAMIRSHHTTITEDHCVARWNSLAKVGLGRYLPLDWQSAYMGAEDLPPRARIAPYVIGGPWVLMDDPESWSAETRETLAQAAALFKRWRDPLRTATVHRPQVDLERYDAVQASTADGRVLLAVGVPGGTDEIRVRPAEVEGEFRLTDEWTGETCPVSVDQDGIRLRVDPAGDGLLISLTPA
ncbi:glycoside hydrolase family 36 protein [Kribbella turkmenica]|uniref:glycoside hydrolase family 36 protein n=1 Tax=Kribbella turkmenica TaxID=2530375 RepID=UPI0014043BB8|nr:glycoside hydrolase family 36 protein [Kribbella turkmenica]